MTGSSFTLLDAAADFYESLVADLAAAKESVRMEMYCIEEGPIAWRLRDVLAERAAAGVEVRLIYDSIGCLSVSDGYFYTLTRAGARVREYHPVNPGRTAERFSIRNLFRRNHRKLIIIDSRIYYLGGMNIGERFVDWADLMARGEGEPVAELAASFESVWRKKRFRPGRRAGRESGQAIQVCDCRPKLRNYPVKRLYLSAIKKAKKRVWIAQAYFIPRRRLVKALIRAKQRGIDVRVLMPDRSDVTVADLAAWPGIRRLADHGVKIFRFREGMFHAKLAVIDDGWATVGTANLDSMSFYWNLEINLVIKKPEIVFLLSDIYEKYQGRCRLMDREEPRNLPWITRTLARLLYYYGWIL